MKTLKSAMRAAAGLVTLFAFAQPALAERVTYIHSDALASPIAATASDGTPVWQEYYYPFGDRERLQGDASNTVWYTGKPQDDGTLLVYMGGRYYNPLIGRFVSIDPAPLEDDFSNLFNRYAYANNNPYRYSDPGGDTPIDVAFLVVDVGRLAAAVASGNPAAIQSAAIDAGISALGVVSPIPGAGQVIKAVRAADKAGDVLRAAKSGPVVIGETMKRVKEAAANIPGSKILNDMPDFRAMGMNPDQATSAMMQYNRKWMLEQMRSGRQIIDIGADVNRARPSIFYGMEQNMLKNYQKLHPEFNSVTRP